MKIRMLEDVHGLVCGEAPNPAQLRAMARPTKPEPCKPGRRCERYARALGVDVPLAPERVEIGRLVLPATSDEYGDPEIDAFMGRIEAVQQRIQKTGARMELPVFVEVTADGVKGLGDGQ